MSRTVEIQAKTVKAMAQTIVVALVRAGYGTMSHADGMEAVIAEAIDNMVIL